MSNDDMAKRPIYVTERQHARMLRLSVNEHCECISQKAGAEAGLLKRCGYNEPWRNYETSTERILGAKESLIRELDEAIEEAIALRRIIQSSERQTSGTARTGRTGELDRE